MTRRKQAGFSLLETMVALAVLLGVGGIVMDGMVQLMNTQGTIANRTEMHTSVRSATELLQQEIGQAGKLSLADSSANVTLNGPVAASTTSPSSFTLKSSTNVVPSIYQQEWLTVDVGDNQETVTVASVTSQTTNQGTATFQVAHASGAPVVALGAFPSGVVPPGTTCSGGVACGSSDTVLKLYGDINGDGNMVYVEYTCSQGTPAAPGSLYRNQMSIIGVKKPKDNTMILLSNILANPNDANNNPVPCFAYQTQPFGTGTCVTNVAVTLTVQTQNKDPKTGQFQPETKALLNVGPRNVVEVYASASLVSSTRAQPMPASVASLLP